MRAQPLELLLGQTAPVANRGVAFDVAHRAHAGDDRRDRRVAEDEAQGDLGELVALDAEVLADRLGALPDLLLAAVAEVAGAEVAVVERRVGADAAGERAL